PPLDSPDADVAWASIDSTGALAAADGGDGQDGQNGQDGQKVPWCGEQRLLVSALGTDTAWASVGSTGGFGCG
ncbi:MAG: hypothetical protein J6C40_09060, partial [Lentisphaeria bacterium]|nr:hypothetical protein [Lentisphaeria bacterium]